MSSKTRRMLALAFAAALCAGPARADAGVTEKLIELLVQKGVLQRDQAAALLSQAQAEAKTARPPRSKAASGEAPAPPVPAGTVRVTYVPELVRRQIADEVRGQVVDQARAEGWAQPNTVPDWISRVKLYGDSRLRYQADLYPGGNYPNFLNVNAINAAGGFNANPNAAGTPSFPPLLDTTQDRERFRVRFRFGALAQVDDDVVTQFAAGTGNDSSPVSFYDTLGGAGGAFSKPSLYLDKANIQATPYPWLKLVGGRAANPFWTTDLQYYVDLNFDGFSASASPRVSDELSLFGTVGAFPVFNSAFNLSTADTGSTAASRDKWLLAAQAGGQWRISDDYAAKFAAGYFDYSNIQGKLSAPCLILVASDTCSSDSSVANFVQQGNTVAGIRNLVINAQNQTVATPQLYGLASKFGVLDLHGRLDMNAFHPVAIALEGDLAENLAFNRRAIVARNPVNNLGSAPSALVNGPYQGGNLGYLLRVTAGMPVIEQLWDWNVSATYKYIETDAVLDAVDDPDFHNGGANAKGYILGGTLGLARNTNLVLRYLSANQVSGPSYSVDTLQIDLNTRF